MISLVNVTEAQFLIHDRGHCTQDTEHMTVGNIYNQVTMLRLLSQWTDQLEPWK